LQGLHTFFKNKYFFIVVYKIFFIHLLKQNNKPKLKTMSEVKISEKFDCAYRVEDSILLVNPLSADGSYDSYEDNEEEWYSVSPCALNDDEEQEWKEELHRLFPNYSFKFYSHEVEVRNALELQEDLHRTLTIITSVDVLNRRKRKCENLLDSIEFCTPSLEHLNKVKQIVDDILDEQGIDIDNPPLK
jgi:hypothetical protein